MYIMKFSFSLSLYIYIAIYIRLVYIKLFRVCPGSKLILKGSTSTDLNWVPYQTLGTHHTRNANQPKSDHKEYFDFMFVCCFFGGALSVLFCAGLVCA